MQSGYSGKDKYNISQMAFLSEIRSPTAPAGLSDLLPANVLRLYGSIGPNSSMRMKGA